MNNKNKVEPNDNLNELEFDDDSKDIELEKLAMGKYHLKNLVQPKTRKEQFNYLVNRYWKRVIIVFLASIIFSFGFVGFLSRANTIPSGLTGLPSLIVLIFEKRNVDLKVWFALIYFAFNIPLLLGFGFKTKKSFIFFVSLFLVFQTITYAIFSIPSVENWIYHTFNVAPGWNKYLYLQDPMTHALTKIENPVTWPILVNAAIGSTLIGIAIALTWKCGGSTGGTDIIVYYLATKVKKNLAFIMTIVSFVSAIVFLIIFGFAAPHSATYTNIQNVLDVNGNPIMKGHIPVVTGNLSKDAHRIIIGLREFGAFIYIAATSIVVKMIYPKYAKVHLQISCQKHSLILKYFKAINYWHAYTIRTVESGYSGNKIYIIETVMLLLESKNIILDIKKLAPHSFILVKPVSSVVGKFTTQYVEK